MPGCRAGTGPRRRPDSRRRAPRKDGGTLDIEDARTDQPVRVLIAEDEALIRLDLKEMLTEEGFDVVAEAFDATA